MPLASGKISRFWDIPGIEIAVVQQSGSGQSKISPNSILDYPVDIGIYLFYGTVNAPSRFRDALSVSGGFLHLGASASRNPFRVQKSF